MPCNISIIPGSSTIYLKFRSSSLQHPQLGWVPWCTFTCKLKAAKYGEQGGPANQLQWTLILDSLDLDPFCTSKNCFTPTFGVYSRLISSFSSWQSFADWTKCHMYTRFRSAIWLVPPDQDTGSRQLFPQMLPGFLLPPFSILKRAWEQG